MSLKMAAALIWGTILALLAENCLSANIDSCLGDLCVGKRGFNERDAIRRFGKGLTEKASPSTNDFVWHCYYDKRHELWFRLFFDVRKNYTNPSELEQIVISDQPLCAKSYISIKSFPQVILPSGIHIGMNEFDFIKLKGRPVRTQELKLMGKPKNEIYSAVLGEKLFIYDTETDLLSNFVYFKNGKISTVWITMAE